MSNGLVKKTVGYIGLFDILSMSELQEIPSKTTTIKLHVTTRQRLAKHGTKDQTYDDLINDLLDKINFGDNQ